MKNIRLTCAILAGKIVFSLIKMLKLGSGSVFAGQVAKRIYPDIFTRLSEQAKKIIYITGTNGKTTTTLLLATLLGKDKTLYNASGANLEAGLVTSLLKNSRFGKLKKENIVFEVDEGALASLLKKMPPHILICLNLFRDQLDRHGEMDSIKIAWRKAMRELPNWSNLVFNGDDPALVYLGFMLKRKIQYFGLNEPEKGVDFFPHAVDSTYCPSCKTLLSYRSIYLSHLGDYFCASCGFRRKMPLIDSGNWPSISPYLYNKYNTMSAVTAALMSGIEKKEICKKITQFSPAFGRGEKIRIQGCDVLFLLSKNSVSLNASISIAKKLNEQKMLGGILLALNDHDADGKDISWIWDAEMEEVSSLSENIFITGKRAYDMALCLTYVSKKSFCPHVSVDPEIGKQALFALKRSTKGKVLCVIPTYTAMLELRKVLIGRKIL